MKLKITPVFWLRISSLAVFTILLICDLLCSKAMDPQRLCCDLWWAVVVLLCCPSTFEPLRAGIPVIAAGAAAALGLKLLGVPLSVHVAFGSMCTIVCVFRRSIVMFTDVEPLFHVSSVWHWIEDYTWLIHVSVCTIAGIAAAAAVRVKALSWIIVLVLAALYYVQYKRVYTRRTMLLGAKKETDIRNAQKGSAFKAPIRFVDSDSKSATLFNEVVSIMENRKPWLRDDFGIDDMARMARTNRMYLSKAINFHSGRNFNQLVNYYRVRYARDLIRDDPTLKMNQVSQMSGFHTVVSFNMAFKLNERMTPTEYAQSLKKVQP